MKFLSNFRKNRTMKSYIMKLPKLLVKDYGGKSQKYSPKQIRKTAERHGLNLEYIGFGIAMFSSKSEFISYANKFNVKWNYKNMRSEIGDNFFGGDTSFNIVFPKKSSLYRVDDGDLWRM